MVRRFISCNGSGAEMKRRVFGHGYSVCPIARVNGIWKRTGRKAVYKTEREAVSHAIAMI